MKTKRESNIDSLGPEIQINANVAPCWLDVCHIQLFSDDALIICQSIGCSLASGAPKENILLCVTNRGAS